MGNGGTLSLGYLEVLCAGFLGQVGQNATARVA